MADLLGSFGIDWRLLIMQAVNFGVLLAALTYFLYKPVLKVLDERRKKIEQGVQDAADAKVHLDNAEQESGEILGKASGEADEMVQKAKGTAEEKGKEIIAGAEARSEAIMVSAQAQADEAAKKALDGSNEEIARTAILAAERLLKKQLK